VHTAIDDDETPVEAGNMKKLLCALNRIAHDVDERGVPLIQTNEGIQGWLHLIGYGLIVLPLGLFYVLLLLRESLKHKESLDIVLLCVLPVVLILAAAGFWCFRAFLKIRKLWTTSKTCAELGISSEELQRIAEVGKILPRYNMDGEDYYDPVDFKDRATLLRASVPPTDPSATLLRPAVHAEIPSEQLLRAASVDITNDGSPFS
jgi:hypothetical protein